MSVTPVTPVTLVTTVTIVTPKNKQAILKPSKALLTFDMIRCSKVTVNVKDNAILYIDNYGSEIVVNKEDGAKCEVWNG